MAKLDFFGLGKKFVIGMVHCLPLPGSPGFRGSMAEIIKRAVADAKALEKAGVDALMIENMGDEPFGITLETSQVAALAAVSAVVAQKVGLPLGIDAAMNDYQAAISIAKAVSGSFVRIPVFVDTVEYYGGIVKPVAREAIMLRRHLQAEEIKIFADIQVKHTHLLLPHVLIEDSAKVAESCGADAIIVTGTHTGGETPLEMIKRVRAVTKLPLIVGSGVNVSNVQEQLSIADGAIVGSSLKEGGHWQNPVSLELASELIKTLQE